MEFKNRKNEGNREYPGGTDEASRHSWLDEEDQEWADLRNTHQESSTKRDKKTFGLFSKESSAFDVPEEADLKKVEVNIKLALPTLNANRFKPLAKLFGLVRAVSAKQFAIVGVGAILLVVGIVVVNNYFINDKVSEGDVAGANSSNGNGSGALLPREKPSFKILYPGNKDADSIGEIVKNSPPGNEPVYNYQDRIGEVEISVSQQELPDNFNQNQDGELQKLAESFQANDVIQVDSVKVFHGQSASGVQSLVFIKGNLLILIASSQKISDDSWAAYISALHS